MPHNIKLAQNINRLRQEKKLTQEDVANFLGITKASVSKWENGQSMPDILLLPQLAAYFHVTIDELMGYEPMLSPEQIKEIYAKLAADFAHEPPETVMEKIQALIHQYYACNPFLIQMALLLINHFMLFPSQEKQFEVLETAKNLCNQVTETSKDIVLIDNGISFGTLCELLMGNAKNVIETLEPLNTAARLSGQNDLLLIQAYQLNNDVEKANTFTQVSMYFHLMSVIENAIQYLEINKNNRSICEETIRRMEHLIDVFEVKKSNPNTGAKFYYQASIIYGTYGNKEQTLQYLSHYCDCIMELLGTGVITFKNDKYFDRVAQWIEASEFESGPPRNIELVIKSAIAILDHPAFAFLKEEQAYKLLRKRIQKLNEI
ncbi:MAG: helix-turn-helix domain-containing protein [Lachnospiraceae bacterium]